MNKYDKHFLMNLEDVRDYAKTVVKFFDMDEELESFEIGDGNINYVFKVVSKKTNKSLIIKQADKLLRSSGRPLDVYRNKIEAEILKIEGELAPSFVPKVYLYDENMCALSMEDISEYKNMRKELMLGKTFDSFSKDISKFLADTILPTTDLVMDRALKKDRVKLFINKELCDITEDLVLTEPYYNYKNRNIITSCNESFVKEHLYENEILKTEVAKLRHKFMNYAEGLIHGDLHLGSIFINEKGIKVIDPEFAFYGPIGYDIGNVIGNLFFPWANKLYYGDGDNGDNKAFLTWIENTVKDTFDNVKKMLERKYDEIVLFELYKNKTFKKEYLRQIMADSLGYAGTEIIRRVVGDSKVMEVSSVKESDTKIKMERALIKIGIYLILNRWHIEEGKEITEEFNLIIA